MQLDQFSVKNFKGLRDISVPVSRFVCLIGENNAGKSSFLQALLLFVEGRKLEPSMYFDPGLPILISVRFKDISESDLALITNDEHRDRFRKILVAGSVTLVRRYESPGTSRLRWVARVPDESRFSEEFIDSLLRSKKPSASFADELRTAFPEIDADVNPKTNQTQARSLIDDLANTIPDAQKVDRETDLPAGFDNTVRPLLPEPIYISAVKDFGDEIATKDSASFGKLLGILLSQVEPALKAAEDTFRFLRTNLNRIVQPDGSISDTRLEAVRNIETLVQAHVRENFPRVELDIRIPPPEIKTVLSGAEIWVNDGVGGLIDTKGDGLKRTVTFSILRTYVELRRLQKPSAASPIAQGNYLFLFEEPELYLHPSAQRILFDALSEISITNHVFVSTHSPLFFASDATGTFIKLAKTFDAEISLKPFARALPVDLSSLDNKSRFQIISYETNNTAFFSDTVVLVEGDSELLVLPHLARVLNEEWTAERTGVAFCRVSGKGNIARYRDFFKAFEVRVCVVGDLDCLLEGFEQLGASEECRNTREELFMVIDAYAEREKIQGKIKAKDIRDMQESKARQDQFRKLVDALTRYRDGQATKDELDIVETEFFSDQVESKRRQILESVQLPEIVQLKRKLLAQLRQRDVYILERGTIEEYYPDSIEGRDKPSKAMHFCQRVLTKVDVLALCDHLGDKTQNDDEKELVVILGSIYRID